MKRIIFAFAAFVVSYGVAAQKITSEKVPSAVRASYKAKFPTATKESWEMESKTEFEVNFKLNGKEVSANFDESGKWLETETEVESASLPAAVQSTLKNEFTGFKVAEAAQIETADGTIRYEAEMKKAKETFEVLLSAEGKILKKTKKGDSKKKED